MLCGIGDDGVFEEGFDSVRIHFKYGHMLGYGLAQFVSRPAGNPGFDGLLQVAVQALIRIQLRGVTGQEENLDLFLVCGEPFLHRRAVMDTEVVEDEKDPAPGLPGQCFEELDQPFVVEVAVDNHPTGLALIGDGGHHG